MDKNSIESVTTSCKKKICVGKGIYRIGITLHIVYYNIDGKQIWESARCNKIREAEALRAKRMLEVREGKNPALKKIPNISLKEFAPEYLNWAEQRLKSYRSRKGYVAQLVNDLGHIPLNKFTMKLVEKWQTGRLDVNGNKKSTVDSLLGTLKHMFTKANERGLVTEYAREQVNRVKLFNENNGRLRYLFEEECQRLIDECEGHIKPIVITALYTGMRRGEILGLKWSMVDLKNKVIKLEDTKNNERREIPIGSVLYHTLLNYRSRIDTEYVFHDKNGRPFKDVKKSFHSAISRAKITNFRFHDLRHTFASQLVMSGVDIVTVQKLLGHKSLTMTLRYAHLADQHRIDAIGKLEGRLKGQKEDNNIRKTLEK